MRRIERRRKQEPVWQKLLGERVEREIAVGNQQERLVAAECVRERARRIGELLGPRASECHDEHARRGAFADALEQEALRGRRGLRQEQAQVIANGEMPLRVGAGGDEHGDPERERE